MKQSEHDIQCAVCQFMDLALPGDAMYFAVPNGGSRAQFTKKDGRKVSIEGQRLKAEGVKAGIPDLMILYQGRAFGIEMKTPKSYQSDSQKAREAEFKEVAVPYVVCRSVEDVEAALRSWKIPLKASLGGRVAA